MFLKASRQSVKLFLVNLEVLGKACGLSGHRAEAVTRKAPSQYFVLTDTALSHELYRSDHTVMAPARS